MESFAFEYPITVARYGRITRGVRLERVPEGVKIQADDAELEKVCMLHTADFGRFNEALGAAAEADVLETTRDAVAAGRQREVEAVIRDTTEVLFTWADWDSGFYGLGQADDDKGSSPSPTKKPKGHSR